MKKVFVLLLMTVSMFAFSGATINQDEIFTKVEVTQEMIQAWEGDVLKMTADEAAKANLLSDEQLEQVKGGECIGVLIIFDDGSGVLIIACQ